MMINKLLRVLLIGILTLFITGCLEQRKAINITCYESRAIKNVYVNPGSDAGKILVERGDATRNFTTFWDDGEITTTAEDYEEGKISRDDFFKLATGRCP
jgi:hypothetical protein